MYTRVQEIDVDIFNLPARLLVSGCSGSGKSFFISRLLRKYKTYFNQIIVIGSDLENCEDLQIKRDDTFNPLIDDFEGSILVIYDDIILNKKLISDAADIFCRGRHMKISIIVLSQNLFFNCKFFRVISLNATHIVLFRMRDLKQISCFGKTFLTKNEVDKFLILYKKIVLKQKYSYLLVDFTKNSEDVLALRSLVANENYEVVYIL